MFYISLSLTLISQFIHKILFCCILEMASHKQRAPLYPKTFSETVWPHPHHKRKWGLFWTHNFHCFSHKWQLLLSNTLYSSELSGLVSYYFYNLSFFTILLKIISIPLMPIWLYQSSLSWQLFINILITLIQ